tara:strand:+ start:211 stop:672 length:462 start_codon:yes stop_codon:yes gene_type:complete
MIKLSNELINWGEFSMSEQASGSCLCGRLSYSFDRDHVISAHHCHCTDCRKMTGSGKATIIMVPTEKLKLNGELKTFTITGSDGSHVARGFCPNCGSQLISYVEEMPDIRFIKAGSLDNGEWVKINSSFWSQSAEPWSPVDPTCPSFTGNPEP